MLLRPLRFPVAVAAFALALAGPATRCPARRPARSAEALRPGPLQPAMEQVDAYLKAQPREPQGRFLKGLLLTEQKKVNEAIQVFTGLTEDFPELPEPYNNLAVLYASLGNYDKAKSALELAIHTHPSYATAHENLGDIYAQLASRAYDRALQLDKNNTTRAGEARDGEGPLRRARSPRLPAAGAREGRRRGAGEGRAREGGAAQGDGEARDREGRACRRPTPRSRDREGRGCPARGREDRARHGEPPTTTGRRRRGDRGLGAGLERQGREGLSRRLRARLRDAGRRGRAARGKSSAPSASSARSRSRSR